MSTTHGDLRKALNDWRSWLLKESQSLLSRNGITPRWQEGLCLALTGVRRCGKTSTAVQLAVERKIIPSTFYFNFEDPVFLGGATAHDIDRLIEIFEEEVGHPPQMVILDEVQNVVGWERWVRKATDLKRYAVVVTGSSSQLLSSEIATAISGRVIEHTIWPLSFHEYVTFSETKPTSSVGWQRALDNFLRWGGFPKAILTLDQSDRIVLLKQYLGDIVLRDVVARHGLRSPQALQQLVTWYLTNVSCLHSYTAVRKAFGISIELAATLTRYLSEAFLAFEVGRYHANLKVQARDAKKIHIIDTGIRTVSLLSEREDWGRLAENAVYIELRRRGCEIFYFRNETAEVDFVITELGKPREAIQVCYSDMENEKTREREFNSMDTCLSSLGLKEGKILTRSFEDKLKMNNRTIQCIPMYRWLIPKLNHSSKM